MSRREADDTPVNRTGSLFKSRGWRSTLKLHTCQQLVPRWLPLSCHVVLFSVAHVRRGPPRVWFKLPAPARACPRAPGRPPVRMSHHVLIQMSHIPASLGLPLNRTLRRPMSPDSAMLPRGMSPPARLIPFFTTLSLFLSVSYLFWVFNFFGYFCAYFLKFLCLFSIIIY